MSLEYSSCFHVLQTKFAQIQLRCTENRNQNEIELNRNLEDTISQLTLFIMQSRYKTIIICMGYHCRLVSSSLPHIVQAEASIEQGSLKIMRFPDFRSNQKHFPDHFLHALLFFEATRIDTGFSGSLAKTTLTE